MNNRNVVVVGGSKGIGLQIVRREASSGAAVTVLSRTAGPLADIDNVTHVTWDAVADELSAEQLPDKIDAFAYCPGSLNLRRFKTLKPQAFRDDYEVNVIGAVKALQAALAGLHAADSASVVFFSTVAVSQGMSAHASIASSKGAIEGLTRSLAAELSPAIRVNCIAPALTQTSLTERFFSDAERASALSKMYALARTGQPDDIASIACMLMSDASDWVTGQVLGVDGGMSSVRN